MRIVFLATNAGYASRYEGVLRDLAERGHHITLVCQKRAARGSGAAQFLRRMEANHPEVAIEAPVARNDDRWRDIASGIRKMQDYVRYFRPALRHADAQRLRVAGKLSRPLRLLLASVASLGRPGRALLDAVLRAAERGVPVAATIRATLRAWHTELLVVTPLVELGSDQVDWVRAARSLGVRTACCVASWDNLTHKGALRCVPDRVFVWNEAQRREAMELHDVPDEHIVVAGAQLFDWWFDRTPQRTYEEFCEIVDLDPARPYVLYLGSSFFICPQEGTRVERWVRAVRNTDNPELAGAGVLVRPHPKNLKQFLGLDLSVFGNVSIQVPTARTDDERRSLFFDAVHHAVAVTGVNTSAMVEAGIAGRSVCTLVTPDLAHAQSRCPHFALLTSVNGGLLHVAHDLASHLQDLAEAIARGGEPDPRARRFTEAFVRPFGLDRPATPVLAQAIDAMASLPTPHPETPGVVGTVSRVALKPLHALTRGDRRTSWAAYPIRAVLAVYVIATRVCLSVSEWASWARNRSSRLVRRSLRRLSRSTRYAVKHLRRNVRLVRDRGRTRLRTTWRRTRKRVVRAPGRLMRIPRRTSRLVLRRARALCRWPARVRSRFLEWARRNRVRKRARAYRRRLRALPRRGLKLGLRFASALRRAVWRRDERSAAVGKSPQINGRRGSD